MLFRNDLFRENVSSRLTCGWKRHELSDVNCPNTKHHWKLRNNLQRCVNILWESSLSKYNNYQSVVCCFYAVNIFVISHFTQNINIFSWFGRVKTLRSIWNSVILVSFIASSLVIIWDDKIQTNVFYLRGGMYRIKSQLRLYMILKYQNDRSQFQSYSKWLMTGFDRTCKLYDKRVLCCLVETVIRPLCFS